MKKFLFSTLLLAGGIFALNHHTEAGVLQFDDCNPTQAPMLTLSATELNLSKESALVQNEAIFTQNPNITPSALVVLDKFDAALKNWDSVIDVLYQEGEDFKDTVFSTHEDWMSTPFVLTKHGLEYAVSVHRDDVVYGNPNDNSSYDDYMEHGDPVLGPHGGFFYIVAYQRNHQVDNEGNRILQLYPVEVLTQPVVPTLNDLISQPNA